MRAVSLRNEQAGKQGSGAAGQSDGKKGKGRKGDKAGFDAKEELLPHQRKFLSRMTLLLSRGKGHYRSEQ